STSKRNRVTPSRTGTTSNSHHQRPGWLRAGLPGDASGSGLIYQKSLRSPRPFFDLPGANRFRNWSNGNSRATICPQGLGEGTAKSNASGEVLVRRSVCFEVAIRPASDCPRSAQLKLETVFY